MILLDTVCLHNVYCSFSPSLISSFWRRRLKQCPWTPPDPLQVVYSGPSAKWRVHVLSLHVGINFKVNLFAHPFLQWLGNCTIFRPQMVGTGYFKGPYVTCKSFIFSHFQLVRIDSSSITQPQGMVYLAIRD